VAEKPRECRARVAFVRALGPDVLEATLRMEEPAELAFDAGQWVSVPFGPKIVRAYSIASPPRARATIVLAADVAPAGLGSRWFSSLAPGDEVRFKGPLGGFVLARSETRAPLFVGEEIGIVPIRSILLDLVEAGLARTVRLVSWARAPHGLVYDEELRALARRYPALEYHPVVGTPEGRWTGAVGAAEALVDRLAPSIENLVVYVAGGEQTIHRVRDRLVARGLERRAVKWEKFW
jgi:CDP-4-dehydro-6-deoxyglucose reductase